jgi:uncharacterized membrane protein YcaP (DUF421 family)
VIQSLRTQLQSALEQFLGLGRNLSDVNSGQMVLCAILMYASALLLVRIGSKRFLSKATPFDVIVAIMLGSILSRAINGSAPFIATVIAGGALVGLHWLFTALAVHTSSFGALVKGEPRVLIEDGKVQQEQMRAAKLSPKDLEEALRLQSQQTDPAKIKRAFSSETAGSA